MTTKYKGIQGNSEVASTQLHTSQPPGQCPLSSGYHMAWNWQLHSLFPMSLFSSVAQSCPTLCNPMDCSTPGLTVHHQLPEFTQTHVHWVGDAIQSSHPLLSPSLLPSIFPSIRLFQMSQLFSSGGQSIGVSASTSVLPMNTQDWPPLGWTGWISLQSKGLSRVFSNTIVQKHQFFSTQLLYSPTLKSIHDYWKNHSLD